MKQCRTLLLLFLTMAGGCSLGTAAKYQTSLDGFRELDSETTASFHREYAKLGERFGNFRTFISSELSKPYFGSDSFSQVVIFKEPGDIRLEAFTKVFSSQVAMFVGNQHYLEGYSVLEKTAYRGSPSRENVEEIFSLPLTLAEMAKWLSGRFVFSDFKEVKKYKLLCNSETGEVALRYFLKNKVINLFFIGASSCEAPHPGNLSLNVFEIRKQTFNRLVFWSKFEFGSLLREKELPHAIEFYNEPKNIIGELSFSDEEVGVLAEKLPDVLFDIRIPRSYPVINLDRGEIREESLVVK